jgi:hypothetical protein
MAALLCHSLVLIYLYSTFIEAIFINHELHELYLVFNSCNSYQLV